MGVIIQDLNSYSNEKDGNFIEFIGKRNSGNLQIFS